MPVFNGDNGPNLLNGSVGDDTINGFGGSDTLNGLAGNDSINPGDNDGSIGDFVEAGLGNDTINFADIVTGWVLLTHNDLSIPITVNINGALNTGSIDAGSDGFDTLLNVANPLNSGWTTGGLALDGTSGSDVFNLTLDGQQWMDVRGLGGNDTINVNATNGAIVRLTYFNSFGSVTADLGAGTIMQDGFTDTITGNPFELRASDNNDSLLGSARDESFIGRGGSDTIDGAAGFDRVRYDRGGNDGAITADLDTGTVTGQWMGIGFTDTLSNIESIRATGFGDVIHGSASNERFDGRNGNDTLRGEGGNDTLFGNNDADQLFGDAGEDSLEGGDGNDALFGGADNDTLIGGSGNDTLNAGDSAALVGFDYIRPGTGNNTVDFVDQLVAFVTVDYFDMNAAITVTLDGAANTGTVNKGNNGFDTFLDVINPLESGWTTGGLAITGTGFADTFNLDPGVMTWMSVRGGAGNDVINITGAATAYDAEDGTAVRIDYAGGGAVTADLAAGTVMQDGFTDTINGTAWEIRGSDSNDSLLGSTADEAFITRGGNDTVDGADGFDRIRYNRFGNDSAITADLGAGTVTGDWLGVGFTDTISNIEWIRGTIFGDTFVGIGGAQLFEGKEGNDTMSGGNGNDTLRGGEGADQMDGGDATDTADYDDASSGVKIDLSNLAKNTGDAVGDTYTSIEVFSGGAFKDVFLGDNGRHRMEGDGGNDDLRGRAGRDTLLGGEGEDALNGGKGRDRLEGGAGNDLLRGITGLDNLQGGKGNDTLEGGDHNDKLTGGKNNDTFVFEDGTGDDTITDFDALNDNEKIDFSGVSSLNNINDVTGPGGAASQVGSDVLIDLGGGNSVLVEDVMLGDLDGNDFAF